MSDKLDYQALYQTDLPTSGAHRPVWPTYGEYRYLPPQRWLHGMEHGGITALYHPCARGDLVEKFKRIVTGCLRRHMISPYGKLSPDRPFALLSWNNRLQLNTPDEAAMISFIKKHALNGREKVARDGQYTFGLLKKSRIVSDFEDSKLCPGKA